MNEQAAPLLMSVQAKASNTGNHFLRVSKDTRNSDQIIKTWRNLHNDCEQEDFWARLRWLIACDTSRNLRRSMQHKRKFRFPAAPQAYAEHPGSTMAQGAHFICVAPGVLGRMAGKGLSSGTVVSGRERHASSTSWNSSRIWTPGWAWERQQTPYYWDFQGTLNTGPQRRSVLMARWWQEGKTSLRSQGPWGESRRPGWGSDWSNLPLCHLSMHCHGFCNQPHLPHQTGASWTRSRCSENLTHLFHVFNFSQEGNPQVSNPSHPFTKLTGYNCTALGLLIQVSCSARGVKVSSTSLLKAHLPQALGPADGTWQLQCCSFKYKPMCSPPSFPDQLQVQDCFVIPL